MSALEKRVSRLEKLVAERTKVRPVCNCRVETTFHTSACMEALIKNIPAVCPVHGVRDLGAFNWMSQQYPLKKEDNQFCPCPPHPWRAWVLLPGPKTFEQRDAFLQDWRGGSGREPDFDGMEDLRRARRILDEYHAARQTAIDNRGGQHSPG